MNFYYTNIEAFSSIVKDNPIKNKEICFWATRYDCFVDKTEYGYGIDNGKYYHEIFMPISVLKRVYVKNNKQKSVVKQS